ncbi:MAG TPA: tRNA uridine-5-carboxymethylaminomethyl(34) synthesis GTPase MnmE [Armatimonadota bacterium]|nr:tRNA uridine-5-carboxymethylaminomethyl(34) synthesis GTPase MnmE [Armatimonadota bacterium]
MSHPDDTIAAIATPIGEGGIGIIRISGRDSLAVAAEMFRPISGVPVHGLPTHTAHYGFALDSITEESIDDGVVTVFRKPRSYTGEDSVEISCHGGIVPLRRVLESALRAGARLAEPGEFTKRAFLNGRLDLAQAEAVLDIVRARTDEALRVARRQFQGVLSTRIRMLREKLLAIIAHIEASIDFPEDVEEPQSIAETIQDAMSHVAALLETADRGRIYREGIQAVIAGRTNVGKSSLLNALVRESRAIVTPIPGTTRDIIEETINIRGIPIRTIDTAGVRETQDEIERIGVDRARQTVEDADLVLAVLDAAQGFTPEDREWLSGLADKKFIVVLNKSDLVRESEAAEIVQEVQAWLEKNIPFGVGVVKTAAPSNEGIVELEDAIAEKVLAGGVSPSEGAIVSNVRHRRALEEARSSLEHALETAQSETPPDLVTIDLKAALDALGSIIGETVSDDVIDRIFTEFCIGK